MSNLDNLSELLASLSPHETKSIRQYIGLENPFPNTFPDLFEHILKKDIAQIQEYERRLGSKKFAVNIQRIYQITLETISLTTHIEKAQIYSTDGTKRLFIRKQIIHAQILGSRSLINQASQTLKLTISQAKETEAYDELLICQYELLNIYAVQNKTEEFSALHTEIKHYEKIRSYLKECFIHYNWVTQSLRKNPEDKVILEKLENILPKMKQFYQTTDSTRIGWCYYRLEIEYCQVKELPEKGYSSCHELLQLQQKSPLFNNGTLQAITYKMLAKFSIMLFRFEEAISYVLKAKKYEKMLVANIDSIKITLFYAHFFKGEYIMAYDLTKDLKKRAEGLNLALYSYFSACCLFLEGKMTPHFIELLSQTKEIEKDKEGWNIHVRLLQIMHLCEGKKWDVAQAHIENLRKHLERTRKSGTIQPRFSAIFKALRELANCGFDFGKALKKQPDLFALLSSETDEDHRWRMLTPEFIRFDVWFEAKARHLHYTEVFAERVKVRQAQNGYLTD